jgi:hypothetical protein
MSCQIVRHLEANPAVARGGSVGRAGPRRSGGVVLGTPWLRSHAESDWGGRPRDPAASAAGSATPVAGSGARPSSTAGPVHCGLHPGDRPARQRRAEAFLVEAIPVGGAVAGLVPPTPRRARQGPPAASRCSVPPCRSSGGRRGRVRRCASPRAAAAAAKSLANSDPLSVRIVWRRSGQPRSTCSRKSAAAAEVLTRLTMLNARRLDRSRAVKMTGSVGRGPTIVSRWRKPGVGEHVRESLS